MRALLAYILVSVIQGLGMIAEALAASMSVQGDVGAWPCVEWVALEMMCAPAARLVEVSHRNDALAAGERTDRRRIHILTSPKTMIQEIRAIPKIGRIVALHRGVKVIIANHEALESNLSDPRHYADD
ncbi:hypothetical protein [Mesorhizobium sp.]|uniref:hypothetical protein n=1 Tax=Mesorhizobium sp. TaxID=1871066 RepID=UPI00257E81EF|nr:hypothetical protein [Mesorhizobium sp.]